MLLAGEPGIGKTRLADQLSAEAGERGLAVFWGRCWESGGAPAFWPWLDVLSSAAARIASDSDLRAALGDSAGLVVELLPGLRERLGELPKRAGEPPERARFALFRAIVGLLRAASGAGALLVIEDVHAADESSLSLLHFVARELRGMSLLIVVTFRDVEANQSAEVEQAIGRLSREGTSLWLARLSEADSLELLACHVQELDPQVAATLWRRAQGNPLFLEQLGRLLSIHGEPALARAELPAGVRDVIRARLARWSARTRALLEAAAVSGDEMDAVLIAEAAQAAVPEVASALADAVRLGVLSPRDRARYRFFHALMREVLVADLAPERKAELHRCVALALEQRQASANVPLTELAHHWLEAASSELDHVVECVVRAADRSLALFAFEEAVTLLERARARAHAAPSRLRAELALALARAEIRRGQGARGRKLCMSVLKLGRELSDPQLVARAALTFGLEITAALVDRELIELLQEALTRLPPDDSALRVLTTARLAAAMQPHSDVEYPIGLAREAIATARRLGDPNTLLTALYTGMSAMMDIVDPRERLPLNLEVEQLANTLDDRERLLHTQVRLSFDALELGDLAGADARIDMLARLARESGAQRYLWRVPLFRSMRALIHGRFAESEAFIEEARVLGTRQADPQLARLLVFHREGLLRASERHAEMIALDPEARRYRAPLYAGAHWQNTGSAFTYARVEDFESARMYLALVPQAAWPLVANPPAFAHLGEPLALLGDGPLVEQVYALLSPARHRMIHWGSTKILWDGPVTRILGLLAARLGRWDEASEHFDRAIQFLTTIDARAYLARTQYEYARALLDRRAPGDATRARALLETARSQAAALEQTGLVRLATQRLAALGIEVSPRPEDAPFSFTAEGEYWSVIYRGQTYRLRDSLGLQYLARLTATPGRSFHALELSGADAPVDAGDAGELLDHTARAAYAARARALREELDEAESQNDTGRAERARIELEFLNAELARAVGLGGRARRAGGASERARSAVQRRIKHGLDRIRECCPEFAEFLSARLTTGTQCVFRLE